MRASLPVLSPGDVLAMLARDRVRAICWLGVAGPPTREPTIEAVLASAEASDDPGERDAAAFAREALGWTDE